MTLDYFIGKICTVITPPSNMPLKDFVQHAQYFTGEVIKIESGIWLKHPQTKTLAFYPFPIVGIVEEQYISPDSPAMDKIKEDIIKKKPKSPTEQTFIPVDELTKMIKKK